jgi:uncharacterized membrane protein
MFTIGEAKDLIQMKQQDVPFDQIMAASFLIYGLALLLAAIKKARHSVLLLASLTLICFGALTLSYGVQQLCFTPSASFAGKGNRWFGFGVVLFIGIILAIIRHQWAKENVGDT